MSLSQTYGNSLYALSKDEGMADEIFSDIKMIVRLFNENPDYLKILNTKFIPKDELLKILNEDFSDRINKYTLNFIKLLCEKHLISHIDECLKAYEILYNKDNKIEIINVTTAKPLDDILEKKIIERMETKTGKKILLKKHIDEKCIGGIIIDMEDVRIDSSVKSQLSKLKKDLI